MTYHGELFTIPGFSARVLQEEDIRPLQRLLDACVDYCMLVDGHPARPNAAASLLSERPDGKALDDKLVIGIFNPAKQMVGLLDALRDYPEKGAWWIGLMLVDPAYRNQGLGRLSVRCFEDWLFFQHAQGVLLGVVEKNEKAIKFWQSLGYEEVGRQPPQQFDNLTHVVITMAHALAKIEHA